MNTTLKKSPTMDTYMQKYDKPMYGLKGVVVFHYGVQNLTPFGYHPVKHTTGLWKHKSRQTVFTWCVEDVGIKYHFQEDTEHILNSLTSNCDISTNWKGANHIGLTIDWNYRNKYVNISISGYINRTLLKFLHIALTRQCHTLHQWSVPIYDQKVKYVLPTSTLRIIDKKQTTCIQASNCTYLYYACALDPCMLPAINEISAQHAQSTKYTNKKVDMLTD